MYLTFIKNFWQKYKDKFSNKYYDLYIPFGRSCHCTMILINEGLRNIYQPFDWLIPSDYSIEPIQERFELFYNFTLFFNKDDYSFDRNKITTSGHYPVINNNFKFEIAHDFETDKSNEENFKLFKIRYLRRYKRMLSNIKKFDKICFVYMVNTWTQMNATSILDLDVVKNNIKILNEQYPSKTIDFIIFEHNPKMRKNKISKQKIDRHIIKYVSNHSYQTTNDKMGDIITIKKILSNYKLSDTI